MAHHLPIPETNCFYSRQEAEQFLQETSYPVVSKTVRGSVARGVHILRSREEASRLVKQVFGRGIVPHNMDPRMIQWDFILFQEYLPEVREQRMIRIGKSYLAINKVIRGDFHSGSGTMLWAKPDDEVLNLTKRISDMGGFESMNVDFFLAQDGRVLVNELHPLFHGPEILVEDLKGRYLFNESLDSWAFEAGNYYRNYCCNLRLINVLDMLNETPNWDWLVKPAFGLANIPN
jgi:glutathione synthase/RimK-type ligase-like ATP-grasp enzyme